MFRSLNVTTSEFQSALVTLDSWLSKNVEEADPLKGSTPAELFFRRKCLNDIALYLQFANAIDPQLKTNHLKRLDDFVLSCVGDDYIDLASQDPRRLLVYVNALSYGLLRRALSPAQERAVKSLLDPRFSCAVDHQFCRRIELCVSYCIANSEAAKDAGYLLQLSDCKYPSSPIYGDFGDLVALTHTAIYAFLMKQPKSIFSAKAKEYTAAWLYRTIYSGELDLGLQACCAAEIYGCADQLPKLTTLAISCRTLTDEGLLVTADQEVARRFCTAIKREPPWAYAFHTMVVGAMAFNAFLRYGKHATAVTIHMTEMASVNARGKLLELFRKNRLQQGFSLACDLLEKDRHTRNAQYLYELIDEFATRMIRTDDGLGLYADVHLLSKGSVSEEQFARSMNAVGALRDRYAELRELSGRLYRSKKDCS